MPPRLPLPGLVQAVLALWQMDRFERYLLKGPPIRTMKSPGLGTMVVVRDPEAIRKLFTAGPDVARAAEINARVLPAIGPGSVMLKDGAEHMALRKLLLPPFHGEAIEGYAGLIEEIAVAELSGWPVGTELAVHPSMQRIALEAILRAVFGVAEGPRADGLRATLPKVLEANPLAMVMEGRFPALGRGRLGRLQPSIRARTEAQRLIREEIAAHRAEPEGRDDVLALLVAARAEDGTALTDAELEDQLMTLLLAGHETTASTLAFCFERLAHNRAAGERLAAEIRSGDGEAYLNAVLDETQRTRPVVEITWRILGEPLELCGYRLPAGTVVVPTIRGVQASEAFEDAGSFRPERFLEGKPVPYSLIPFGGGPRRCLGASFARLEMRTVLRVFFERFDLEPIAGPGEPRNRTRRFSTIPQHGARITVRRRVGKPAAGAAA
jgi:cytochrome P450 family 135